MAVLWNPTNPRYAAYEFDSAFAAMSRERAGALFVLGDAMFNAHRTRLADLTLKSRLPAMHTIREAGGLMSYGVSLRDLYRRAAVFVDKILKGAKPADLTHGAADAVRAGD